MGIMDHSSIDADVYTELIKRTLGINVMPIIYPINATAKLNAAIAVQMRDRLQKKMWGFLIDETGAEDWLSRSAYNKEFMSIDDVSAKSFFLAPYVQTSLLINECINLSMIYAAGNLKLIEPSGARKDRYTSLSYGNYYASLLDHSLLKEEADENDFEILSGLVQST